MRYFWVERSFNFIKNSTLTSLKFSNFDLTDIISKRRLNWMWPIWLIPFCIISPINFLFTNNRIVVVVMIKCWSHTSKIFNHFIWNVLILIALQNFFLHFWFSICLKVDFRSYLVNIFVNWKIKSQLILCQILLIFCWFFNIF